MAGKNKFGFDPLPEADQPQRKRAPGPMGTAVREAAASLSEATEVKVEQRKQNAADAKAFREAQDNGLILTTLPLEAIHTDALPRDRLELDAVAGSDEMEELKASIAARGQREPVEVYLDANGAHQLKKGWRRYTALSQLLEETGKDRFSTIIARVSGGETHFARYLDMVEENIIREDLTFAEMAALALRAAEDPAIDGTDPDTLVGSLYASLHKMKRSYIRSFLFLLQSLGASLQWPKAVSRNLGVDVARAIKAGHGDVDDLKATLSQAQSADGQNAALVAFLSDAKPVAKAKAATAPKQKFEFHVGATKVTARRGECRILSGDDFSSVPRERLEAAVRAFEAALKPE